MEFNPKKTSVKIINEEAFGGTYFRDIYSGVNRKRTEIHGQNSIN